MGIEAMRKIDWESQIGRRLKLRDLHVFLTVAQRGSMAKAAAHLGVSQPAVSEVISDLEHTLGVRLLDRSPQGVEPTMYGRAMIERSVAAFDELKQGIRTIEALADPSVGELWVGCPESISASILPSIMRGFIQQHPRVAIHVRRTAAPSLATPSLRERRLDLVLARIVNPLGNEGEDLNVEPLFEDHLVVAAGLRSRWARRRKIDLAELVEEPWVLTPPDCWTNLVLAEAFQARGLGSPKVSLTSYSVPLRLNLIETGMFLTVIPNFTVPDSIRRYPLKVLPVDLPDCHWPFGVVTLKNRTLTPVAQRFLEHLRAFVRSREMDAGLERKSA